MTQRLRTAKIDGVKGVRREIVRNAKYVFMDHWAANKQAAIVYGQWAICCDVYGYDIVHVPTGRTTRGGLSQADARSLIAALLSGPEFKTVRAIKSLARCKDLYRKWQRRQA